MTVCIRSLPLSPNQEERELGTVARRGLEQVWKGWSEKLRRPEGLGPGRYLFSSTFTYQNEPLSCLFDGGSLP